MQTNRLFKILYYILNNKKVTAKELSQKFEVSTRTIYREIDIISSLGIPIYATQGKNGGISILDGFSIDNSLLSSEEKEDILSSLQAINQLNNKKYDDLIIKLSSIFKTKFNNWIEVDFSYWGQSISMQHIFDNIKNAILNRNIINFTYFNTNGENTKRIVYPIKLLFKSGNWYLYGFCKIKDDYRLFKLTRIKNLEITNQIYYEKIQDIHNIDKNIKNEKTILVKLKFDKKIAFRVYDEFSDCIIKEEREYLYVSALLPDYEGLYSYLFSFLEYLEVLEPIHIRENFLNKLNAINNNYSNTTY